MFDRRSRYRDNRTYDPRPDTDSGFDGVYPREIGPAPGVVEHRIQDGERLDQLAAHYYNDPRLWWRIVDANAHFLYGGDLVFAKAMAGRTIVIPRATE
ncbi:MAG: hypothetical protein GY715_04035 [Planctomycetes bacterium]|nr:hypothetical protein [Planctomycetota bacterium]